MITVLDAPEFHSNQLRNEITDFKKRLSKKTDRMGEKHPDVRISIIVDNILIGKVSIGWFRLTEEEKIEKEFQEMLKNRKLEIQKNGKPHPKEIYVQHGYISEKKALDIEE